MTTIDPDKGLAAYEVLLASLCIRDSRCHWIFGALVHLVGYEGGRMPYRSEKVGKGRFEMTLDQALTEVKAE